MHYFPHTPEEIREMFAAIGVGDFDDLFAMIPKNCRRKEEMGLPPAMPELELNRHLDRLAASTAVSPEYNSFLGAGRYDHFIPHVIPYLLSRSEFSTSYTPYQPEVSQGTLQAIFEYQTLTARLLGMDVANASLYDGASALAEALLMAIRIAKKKKIAISRLVHPHYRQVVESYFASTGYELIELDYLPNGRTDVGALGSLDDLAGVAIQSPNVLGCIEDVAGAAAEAKRTSALTIVCFTEAMAYGLLKSPGDQGADIACGEGQSFGIPMAYGGPGLGMLTCRQEYMRSIPGRLVGQTVDLEGKRGYVLTLATREQHIRREKATSNICTNSGLCALAASIYLSSAGRSGLRELAAINHDKAVYLCGRLKESGATTPFSGPFFNEFVVRFEKGFKQRYDQLLSRKVIAGWPLGKWYPELADHYLLSVTEAKTKQQMDNLVKEVTT